MQNHRIVLSVDRRVNVLLASFLSLLFLLWATPSRSHEQAFSIGGDALMLRANGAPSGQSFYFSAFNEQALTLSHDPTSEGTSVLVRGTGADGGRTPLAVLDPTLWSQLADGSFLYNDPSGSRGGITHVRYAAGMLRIRARGANWGWQPAGPQDSVWVHFQIEDETFCAEFSDDTGANTLINQTGLFRSLSAAAPVACPEQICGNGEVEFGEDCDDGNLDDNDGCTSECTVGACEADVEFDTTWDAVQSVVFDSPVYSCTNLACHGALSVSELKTGGGLDLRAPQSYENLLNYVDPITGGSTGNLLPRVQVNEPDASFLYLKLAEKTFDIDPPTPGVGTPMPSGAPALTEDHLQGVYQWIRGGAPETGVVEGTAQLFGTCLPEPTPLVVDPPPDAPERGIGFQLAAPPWDLPQNSEGEVCYATYYDLTELVPPEAEVPCPKSLQKIKVCSNAPTLVECETDLDCGRGQCVQRNVTNEAGRCFAFHKTTMIQDAQSHHTIMFQYRGEYDADHEDWGDWTYKLRDQEDPQQGQECDPKAVDPALGYNPNCSSEVEESVACIFWGPPDFSNFGNLTGGGSSTAPQFTFTQEAYWENEHADGVYEVLPMQGILGWNSHAFNFTDIDSTMAIWLNFDYAMEEDQQHVAQDIFEGASIFVQDIPAFEKREYCRTYTVPKGGHLFHLTSHTHLRGVKWRIWNPPNTPCIPRCPDTPAAQQFGCERYKDDILPEGLQFCEDLPNVPREDQPFYFSTSYSDPVQLYYDEPIPHDQEDDADRTYLYCAEYDNGSGPGSPPVKRQSTSPPPPFGLFGQAIGIGGPCSDDDVVCLDGPQKGELCGGDDNFCGGEGLCDACPSVGGVTSEDEMFILIGGYFCPDVCIGGSDFFGTGDGPDIPDGDGGDGD